ncbi:MAG: MGDG synthase family glycosyltransferase [Culicoidibacterales bacterium]
MKKALILTAPYGQGHMQASNALVESFEKLGYEIITYDMVSEERPFITKILKKSYQQFYRPGLRRLYGASFKTTDTLMKYRITGIKRPLLISGDKRALMKLEAFNPDVVIMTYPLQVFYTILMKWQKEVPVYTVVTDFHTHSFWMHKRVTGYFFAHPEIERATLKKLPKITGKTQALGIPIRSQFLNHNRNGDSKKTIIYNAGAFGVNKNAADTFQFLLDNLPYNIQVICGKNEKMYNTLLNLLPQYQNRLEIFGYVDDIATLYNDADLVITKAGGITVSEVAAMQIIPLFIQGVPGQEEANIEFFVQHGAGFRIKTPEQSIRLISTLLSDDELRKQVQNNLQAISRPNAADNITAYIDGKLNGN